MLDGRGRVLVKWWELIRNLTIPDVIPSPGAIFMPEKDGL